MGERSRPRPMYVSFEQFGATFDGIFKKRNTATIPQEQLDAVLYTPRSAPAYDSPDINPEPERQSGSGGTEQ